MVKSLQEEKTIADKVSENRSGNYTGESYNFIFGSVANEFYGSNLYALLEQEDTKIWHFSPLTLFNMFDEEKKTGSFELPEEA